MSTITHHGNTFEVVTKWPLGYEIWNIGDGMADGYLPLCRPAYIQCGDGGRDIETNTLKAIRVNDDESLKTLRKAAHFGCTTRDKTERFLARFENNVFCFNEVQIARQALVSMERLERGVV